MSAVAEQATPEPLTLRPTHMRNVAIIAHVDHGKTTLVDSLLKACGELDDDGQDRVMDSMDQERERGITIASKITGMRWRDTQLQIVDTPGHADFGGEVERVLQLVDGVIIVVDATDGPNTQTRYVTSKALERGLQPLVVINKVDRDTADIVSTENAIFDLFVSLNATDEQLETPFIHASARSGWAVDPSKDDDDAADAETRDMSPLLDAILEHLPAPAQANETSAGKEEEGEGEGCVRMLVSMMSHDPYLGRLVTGKVEGGTLRLADEVNVLRHTGEAAGTGKVTRLLAAAGTGLTELKEAPAGSIVTVAGICHSATVSDTLIDKSVLGDLAVPIPTLPIDPATVAMTFSPNGSPLAGREGTKLNSSQLSERLNAEKLNNVSITVLPGNDAGSFEVRGRGDMQLAVLIETLRREGFELSISPPRTLDRRCPDTGRRQEPYEKLHIDVQEEHCGLVMEKLNARRGQLMDMSTGDDGRTHIEYVIPARALIGYRVMFTQDTHGSGVMNKIFHAWDDYAGAIAHVRVKGALVSTDQGRTKSHSLALLEPRGYLFVGPQTDVYVGMIIGEHSREKDLNVNPTRGKALSNMRTSGNDDTVVLTPPRTFTLDEALGYVRPDELLEVTPSIVRMRKAELDPKVRQVEARKTRQGKR